MKRLASRRALGILERLCKRCTGAVSCKLHVISRPFVHGCISVIASIDFAGGKGHSASIYAENGVAGAWCMKLQPHASWSKAPRAMLRAAAAGKRAMLDARQLLASGTGA